jgi:sugar transferase (PEP-CTERM system associated)
MLLGGALLSSLLARQIPGTAIMIAACGIFFHLKTVDKSIISFRYSHFLMDVVVAVVLGIGASALLFYMLPSLAPAAGTVVAAAAIATIFPLALRPFLLYLIDHKKLVEGILVVGTGELARRLYRLLANDRGFARRREEIGRRFLDDLEGVTDPGVAIDFARLNEIVVRDRISQVIVAEQDAQARKTLAAALLDPRLRGLDVHDAVDFYEAFSGKIWVEALDSEWFVFTDGFHQSRTNLAIKRLFDLVCAPLLLLLTSPLLACIGLAIKLNSNGQVLFRQERVGLYGKTFTLYKFRSMRQDAELETGPVWAREHDDRATAIGRVLRRFHMDELPQLINVLRGEMSFVGPRPERPHFVDRLEKEIPFFHLRHYVKPGITGWAQVMYSYGDCFQDAYEKLQYDFYYAKHWSLGCDLKILWRTVTIVLFGRGR